MFSLVFFIKRSRGCHFSIQILFKLLAILTTPLKDVFAKLFSYISTITNNTILSKKKKMQRRVFLNTIFFPRQTNKFTFTFATKFFPFKLVHFVNFAKLSKTTISNANFALEIVF